MQINFEVNKDKVFLQRNVYTSLDMLSDIGGIQGLLVSMFAVVTALFNTSFYEEHLVHQLFTFR